MDKSMDKKTEINLNTDKAQEEEEDETMKPAFRARRLDEVIFINVEAVDFLAASTASASILQF